MPANETPKLEAEFREEHLHSTRRSEQSHRRKQCVKVVECESCGARVAWRERNDEPHDGRQITSYIDSEVGRCL